MEEIVNGIETFREAFTPFADSFIVIGGSACRAVIPDGDIRPRKTTDIDMVLVPQELSADFIGTFWKFIKEGGYKFASRKNSGGDRRYVFYSFVDGKEGYPDQIELLSKPDESIGTPAEHHIEYIDTGEEYSHLSAIIQDRNYYDYLTSHFETVDGIRYASADALVCLKALAYLNLTADKRDGKRIARKVLEMLPDDFIAILLEMQRRTVYGTACPIDDARFKKSAPEMDKETRKALTMWTMGLGNSNKRFSEEDFNPDKVKKATAESWKTKPMEEPAIEVDMNFRISARQMEIISYGHIPEAMEDHWFMYCDDAHIRYYRSWTGLFVFDASYVKSDDGDGFVIVKLSIHPNGDYSKEYERKQTALFKALLMDECGGSSEEHWNEYLQ